MKEWNTMVKVGSIIYSSITMGNHKPSVEVLRVTMIGSASLTTALYGLMYIFRMAEQNRHLSIPMYHLPPAPYQGDTRKLLRPIVKLSKTKSRVSRTLSLPVKN
jgi:hypothetical protein